MRNATRSLLPRRGTATLSRTILNFGEAARFSPYSPLGILRQALASHEWEKGRHQGRSRSTFLVSLLYAALHPTENSSTRKNSLYY
ncbi:hypothetical protein [Nostoc sp.]|uniref:hypothetical protein n=1 Tax=Nostoc sp. TaxID=1180 RepID=UPI002FF7C927